jgi:hypothetical protein
LFSIADIKDTFVLLITLLGLAFLIFFIAFLIIYPVRRLFALSVRDQALVLPGMLGSLPLGFAGIVAGFDWFKSAIRRKRPCAGDTDFHQGDSCLFGWSKSPKVADRFIQCVYIFCIPFNRNPARQRFSRRARGNLVQR